MIINEIIDLLDQARAKIKTLRDSLPPEKDNEESEEWVLDGVLEEAADLCKNATSALESAMESTLEEA